MWPFSFVCTSHTLLHLRCIRKFGVRYIEFKYSESNFFSIVQKDFSEVRKFKTATVEEGNGRSDGTEVGGTEKTETRSA